MYTNMNAKVRAHDFQTTSCVYTHPYTNIYICTHIYIFMYKHLKSYTLIDICMHVVDYNLYTNISTSIVYVDTNTYVYIYMWIHLYIYQR